MKTPFVMTIIGPDKPGLVDSVASLVIDHKGNWLESRMCRLGGQFAGLLQVEIEDSMCEDFRKALEELEVSGLEIVVHKSAPDTESKDLQAANIEILGQDRPGIVLQIANAFAVSRVNVEELSTECYSAPMSGERLFEAKAKVCIPESCDTEALRQKLESIAADLQVDFSYELLS